MSTTTPGSVSFLPATLDLSLYAGDGMTLRLAVGDPLGDPIPLDGTIEAEIRATRAATTALASFSADLSEGATGIVELSLTGVDTAALVTGAGPFSGVWDAQWTPAGGQPLTLVQGEVECAADVTRP